MTQPDTSAIVSEAEQEFFHRQGYLVLPGLIDTAECRFAKSVCRKIPFLGQNSSRESLRILAGRVHSLGGEAVKL